MQQQIATITLGIEDIERSKSFYVNGFNWSVAFENEMMVFYQMNGFVLGTFLEDALAKDAQRESFVRPGPYTLAHNVANREAVPPLMEKLLSNGGTLLRAADEPPHGGYRGYISDPDDHSWEIAWNPAWPIDDDGHVTFKPPSS